MPRVNPPYNPSMNLRDLREQGWFWVQNELLDVFAPHIGVHAILVYIILARHCTGNNSEVTLSLRQIVGTTPIPERPSMLGERLSKTAVMRALVILESAGLLLMIHPATRTTGAHYGLPSLSKAAACFTEERQEAVKALRQNLVDRSVKGGPHGTTSNLSKNLSISSEYPVENHLFSTNAPGPQVVPADTIGGPAGDHYLKNTENTENTTPLPPFGKPVKRASRRKSSEVAHG